MSSTINIRDLLVAAGVGTAAAKTGWTIEIGREPQTPDQAITIYATGGIEPNPKYLLDYPSVMVLVRGKANDYLNTEAKATAVKNALLGINSQTVNGDRIDSITMASDISLVGYDENGRPRFSVNFRMIVEPASGTNRVSL